MEITIDARNVVSMISTKRAVYARRLLTCSKLLTCSFASVKSSKKKGLPGILRLVMLPMILAGCSYFQ